MPNYSLVANSVFQPFTYQELLAPVLHQQQVFDNLAEQYDKLSSQADVLEAMGSNEKDKNSAVYRQYKNYSDALRAEADNLYRNGLSSESRMRLTDLRRMYNQQIVPIQNAYTKREKEAEIQMKAQLDASSRGIDLYFSRNAADTPLQSYLDNPNQTFRTINGQALMNEVAAQFKGLASQLQDGKIKKDSLSPIEYKIISQKGMDYNEYMDFIKNPKAPEFKNIRRIVDNTLAAHGAQDFDVTTQERLFGLASQGVAAGVGARDMQFHTDPYAQTMLNYELQERHAANEYARKAALERAKAQAAQEGSQNYEDLVETSEYELPMGGANWSNSKEHTKAMKTLGYVDKDGKLSSTGKVTINNKEVPIFNKNGKIMNRREFLAQAPTAKDREAYSKYFDKMVEAGQTLGVYGQLYTQKELSQHYNDLVDQNAAQKATVYALNYDKNSWNPTAKGYQVRELKHYRDGKPVFDTKKLTLNDVLNMKDSNKNDANIEAFWSNSPGNRGIILATTIDGKNRRFFIDATTMPEKNVQMAMKSFNDAEEYRKQNDTRNARKAIAYAITLLHTGLTGQPKKDSYNTTWRPTAKEAGLTGGVPSSTEEE